MNIREFMRFARSILLVSATFLWSTELFLAARGIGTQAPTGQTQQQPPSGGAPAGTAPGQAPPGGGRGGGRGNAGAALFTATCSGCHGTTELTGRAPWLFDQKWLDGTDDEKIATTVRKGVPEKGMVGFTPEQLSDPQIFQLIAYIRTATANLKPKPTYVADPDGHVVSSEKQAFKMEVLSRDVNTPFGLAFLPDGRLLITERNGTLRVLDKNKLSEPIKGTPKPHVQQDGGFLDVTVHPQYAKNGWIYLSYSEVQPGYVAPPPTPPADAAAAPAAPAAATPPAAAPAPAGNAAAPAALNAGFGGGQGRGRGGPPQPPSNTVIVRGKINKNNEWTDQQVVFRSPTELYVSSSVHFGSRFAWDREGHLFFTLGERGTMQNAQDLKNPLGKVHRVNDDGTVPKDNPFVNTPAADATIWSYGHRNPEGLAWEPGTGRLWESEHGPSGGDEINIIEKGHNYGWGVASKGLQGGITKTSEPGMDDPIVYYTPAIAPAGITFYTGTRYPGWKNTSLFVGGLVGQQLRRLEISDEKVVNQEILFAEFGRVRDIVQGPDGYLYVALQSPTGGQGVPLSAATPGMIIRLLPGDAAGRGEIGVRLPPAVLENGRFGN
jgi:aldose sugar dehydrogenase